MLNMDTLIRSLRNEVSSQSIFASSTLRFLGGSEGGKGPQSGSGLMDDLDFALGLRGSNNGPLGGLGGTGGMGNKVRVVPVCLYACVFVCLCICLFDCLSVCLSLYLFDHVSIHLPVYFSVISSSVCHSVCISACQR